MNNEEFIIKFYACDNQEQFLKDVYHNLNCLQNQVEKLTQENNDLEELLSKQYMDGLRQGKFDNEMELINLKQINIELNEKIDKAIKYIKWQYENPSYDNVWRKYEVESLLEILRSKNDN